MSPAAASILRRGRGRGGYKVLLPELWEFGKEVKGHPGCRSYLLEDPRGLLITLFSLLDRKARTIRKDPPGYHSWLIAEIKKTTQNALAICKEEKSWETILRRLGRCHYYDDVNLQEVLTDVVHDLCTIYDAKELISSKPKGGMKPQHRSAAPIHHLPHLQHSVAPRRYCCCCGCF